jgi:hypothetical protein
VQHYLDHHLAQPLMRIFEPVVKDVRAELLSGARACVCACVCCAFVCVRFVCVRLVCVCVCVCVCVVCWFGWPCVVVARKGVEVGATWAHAHHGSLRAPEAHASRRALGWCVLPDDAPPPPPPPPRAPSPGAHTRSITVATPSTAAGGIMRFAKVKPTCLACRCVCVCVAVCVRVAVCACLSEAQGR